MGGQRGLEVSVDVHVFSRVFPHSRCSALSAVCMRAGVFAEVFALVCLRRLRCVCGGVCWCVCGGVCWCKVLVRIEHQNNLGCRSRNSLEYHSDTHKTYVVMSWPSLQLTLTSCPVSMWTCPSEMSTGMSLPMIGIRLIEW